MTLSQLPLNPPDEFIPMLVDPILRLEEFTPFLVAGRLQSLHLLLGFELVAEGAGESSASLSL